MRLAADNVGVDAQGKPLLRGISFSVEPCASRGIMGPSGCGKTTLLRALCGLHPLAEGKLLIDGAVIQPQQWPAARARLGFLPQEPPALAVSSAEFLEEQASWKSRRCAAPRDALDAAAHELGLDSAAMKHPWRELSTGERRRAALAVLLAWQPRLLLLDEPDENLDAAAASLLRHALCKRLTAGCGLIVVSHRLETLRALQAEVLVLGADNGGAP